MTNTIQDNQFSRTDAYRWAEEARRYFTDATVDALLARGTNGDLSWADVADMLQGAVTDKVRS